MPQFSRHSLHSKLIVAFMLVLLIPTVVISAHNQWRTQSTLLAQAADEHLQLAKARADTVESMIAHGQADMLFVAQDRSLRRYGRGESNALSLVEQHFMTFLSDSVGRYSGLCLLDTTGREQLCVRALGGEFTAVPVEQLASRHDQLYFVNTLRRAGIPGNGPVEVSSVENGALMRYSTLIENDDGLLAGVVVMEAPTAPIFALLRSNDRRVRSYLVEADGRFLIHSDNHAHPDNVTLRNLQPHNAERILREPQGVIIGSAERPDVIQVFTEVRPPGQSTIQWTVIYEQPLDGIHDEVREIWFVNLAITAAALIIALFIGTLLARGIVRPVEALAAAAERVGSGDLHTLVPHAGADEIAALGRTLDRTVTRLREAVEFAERRRQEAETLSAATRAISSTLALDHVLNLILSELRKVVPYDSASVQTIEGDSAVIIGAYGLINAETLIGSRFSLVTGESPNAEVVRTRAAVLLDDAPARYQIFRSDPYRDDPIHSWLGVPMLFGDRLIGMITLDKHEAAFYSPAHARLALDFAAQAAIALENASLYESARTELAERRRAEAANARLAAIIEATVDGVTITELSGRILYLNQALRDLVGLSQDEELHGLTASDLVPEPLRARITEEILPVVVERGSWKGELTLLSRSGEEIPVSQVIIAHYSPDGAPEHFSTIIRDIRERHRAEEELRQSQKMEALGRLAGGLAHDFNNLLTVVLGECDLVLADMAQADPNRLSIEQIRQSGERAAALTRQLLAFSRRQVLQPELLNFNEVIVGMEQMLRRLIGEDIALTIALAHNLPTVRADSGQIEQVVMNLAINARDAMPDGGRLLIETIPIAVGIGPGRQNLEIAPGLYATLTVSDTGVGIDAEVQAHIFEPFFTTKPRGKGTGLGLATVHGIVRQSGGYIWFSSAAGQGSSFTIYLPAVVGPPRAQPGPESRELHRASAETVLLVEDDEHVRSLARGILLRSGFTVLEAADGSSALALARAHQGSLDTLLTDVVMPGGLNGVQLANAIRALRPSISVVYMSGYTDNALLGNDLADGNVNYIQKPFTPDDLVHAILEALARQRPGRV